MLSLVSNKTKLDKNRNRLFFSLVIFLIAVLYFSYDIEKKNIEFPALAHTAILIYFLSFLIFEIWYYQNKIFSDLLFFTSISKECSPEATCLCETSCSANAIAIGKDKCYVKKEQCKKNLQKNCLPCAKSCAKNAFNLDFELK